MEKCVLSFGRFPEVSTNTDLANAYAYIQISLARINQWFSSVGLSISPFDIQHSSNHIIKKLEVIESHQEGIIIQLPTRLIPDTNKSLTFFAQIRTSSL